MCVLWRVSPSQKNVKETNENRKILKIILRHFPMEKKNSHFLKIWNLEKSWKFSTFSDFEIFRFQFSNFSHLKMFRKNLKTFSRQKNNLKIIFFPLTQIFLIAISRTIYFEHYFDSKTHVCDIRRDLASWSIVQDHVKFWKISKNSSKTNNFKK